jgi:hypothetical protein
MINADITYATFLFDYLINAHLGEYSIFPYMLVYAVYLLKKIYKNRHHESSFYIVAKYLSLLVHLFKKNLFWDQKVAIFSKNAKPNG